MKRLAVLILSVAFSLPVMASDDSHEEPVQHLDIADVTSLEDAKRIFVETTAQIRSKEKLDLAELQQIHIITYSLEQSVAYFVENTEGERHELAEEIAEVVEEIHISSENGRQEETKEHLEEYFDMADRFAAGF